MASEEKPSGDGLDRPIEDFSNKIDIPSTYEPPSPLTGCYLLIILGEPHSQEHKDIILQRLLKGLLSWNVLDCHVDLEEELNSLTNHAPEGEAARHGERLIQFASENLVTEILIHPQYNTLIQCMRNLLSSFTRHRHIIHSGYTFSGNGSWILQDATFSVSDFAEALQDYEVQRVMRAYPDTISIEIHCAIAGHWNKLPEKSYAKQCKIRINSVDILDSGSDKINAFINYLSPLVAPAGLNELMESSDVVGNIRFSHPTLYVFPGGQGDAALFGINGFNMLVDGGFNRKSCFWDFTRHLDRLDAVLMTRVNNANIQGLSSVIERKAMSNVYPQIGYFFTNIPETKTEPSLESDKDSDPLLVNLFERGQSITSNLKSINLKPTPCYKDIEPINLYHKVGHGTLDMYVLSPSKDSKEVKEFLQKWNARDQNLFATKQSKDFQFPLQNLVSICAMLVWQPANPEETITRILFPGSTPDYKIMEGLDKLKHLEFVKHPVCTANQIEASFSSTILTKKQLKSALTDKSSHEPILPSKVTKSVVAQEKDNKTVTETKTIIKTEKETSAVDGEPKAEAEKDEMKTIKPAPEKDVEKDNKTASESKPVVKSRIDSRPPKSMDRKLKKDSSTEKKSSPITTPKKEPKQTKDKEIKSRVISRVTKSSPSSTPAKSTKEANNRKVFESKQRTVRSVKKEVTQTATEKKEVKEVKEVKVERKAISRRPKPSAGSPMKSVKSKTSKDTVIRRPKSEKGATSDSSVVSTPSADDVKVKKPADEKQLLLDDLIEEQEAVREIEAVLQRSDDRNKDVNAEHRAIIDKQDSTTEADEDEEYIIIEKEEPYTEDSVNEPESAELTGKEEVKHQRDSQESEKKRKPSIETTEEEEPQPTVEQPAEENKEIIESAAAADKPAETKEEELEETIPAIHKMNGDIPKPKDVLREEAKSDEASPISDEKQASDEKKADGKEELGAEKVGDAKEAEGVNVPESQATAESGATTAPTLPEDEHITLDEIKEDAVIEEKYIKEETKETQVIVTAVDESIERAEKPKPIRFDSQQPHLRELNIKTPDEVADLPVHEEADITVDGTPAGSRKASLTTKQEQPQKTETVEIESKDIKEEDDKLELDIDTKAAAKDEKSELKSPTEKKSPTPSGRKTDDSLTKIEAKIASPVEKVEYKVEDLGQPFENTLKDVTGKVDLTAESTELKGKSPVDDGKPEQAIDADDKEQKDDVERKSISPPHDVKVDDEIEKEIVAKVDEVQSVSPTKDIQIETERKESVAEPSSDIKVVSKTPSPDLKEKIASKSPSPELKDETKQVETVIETKATSLTPDNKYDIDIVGDAEPIEADKSKSPSPVKDEKISESRKESIVTELKEIDQHVEAAKDYIETKTEDVVAAESSEVDTKEEKSITPEKLEPISVSPVKDVLKTEEKAVAKSPSPDLKEQTSVSPAPETKETVAESVGSAESKRASLIDNEIQQENIVTKDESKSPSPTKDDQIIESRKQSVADTVAAADIERKSASPIEKEQISSPPKSVTPSKDDIISPERKDSLAAVEEQVKSSTPTDLKLQSQYTEVYDYSHPFDPQYPNELRETHITTVESPIVEKSKLIDLQVIDKTITETSLENDDSPLNDIKEEEEEERASPPRDDDSEIPTAIIAPPDVDAEHPRSVSPREQEVLKIVVNVAEVLKSERDITDIIPDFNEDELEKHIMQRASTPEVLSGITKEFEIGLDRKGSTIDVHDLSASLSEAKTSTTSIDEKEQHEIAEKHQAGFQKDALDSVDLHSRKESFVSEALDDSRRESAISTFSEKDFTKDESSVDKFSRSNSSLDLKHDEIDIKSTGLETQSDVTQIESAHDAETVQAAATDSRRESLLSEKPASTTPEKIDERKSSATEEIIEKASEEKAIEKDETKESPVDDKARIEREESLRAKLEEDNATVQRMLVTASSEDGGEEIEICAEGTIKFSPSATTPEIFSGIATPEVGHDDLGKKTEIVNETVETTHTESTLDVDELARRESTTSRQSDRPESAMSHFSDTTEPELKETCSSPEKHVHDKADEKSINSSGKSTGSPSIASSSHGSVEIEEHKDETIITKIEHKEVEQKVETVIVKSESGSESSDKVEKSSPPAIESEKRDESRPESRESGDKIESKSSVKDEHLEEIVTDKSRSQSIVSEKPDVTGKATPAELSRPESAASDEKDKVSKSPAPSIDTKDGALIAKSPAPSIESEKKENLDKTEDKPMTSNESRPESAASDKKFDEPIAKSPSPSIESAKKDSLVDDKKLETKESSRPESAVSGVSVEHEQKSPIPLTKVEPTDTKPESRSQSVASAVSEEKVEIAEAQKSRSQSIVSEKQDASGKATPAESSRPESVASDKKSDEPIPKSPSPSIESVKKDSLEKTDDKISLKGDTSRPVSALSDMSAKEIPKSSSPLPKEEPKAESRSQSVASVASEEKVEVSVEQKLRSQSIVSEKQDISGKATPIEASRPESSASDKKDEVSKSPAPSIDTKDGAIISKSPAPLIECEKKDNLDNIDDKPLASGESRPESSASKTSEKDEQIEKTITESHRSSIGDTIEMAREVVKSPSPSVQSEQKDLSRPESRVSDGHVTPSTKDDEKTTEKSDEKSPADKSRSQSIVSEKQDASGKATPADLSRPESAASHISDAKETAKLSIDLGDPHSDDKIEQKSHSPSLKEEQIEEESTSSKIDSRSGSIASAIDLTKEFEKSTILAAEDVKIETTAATTIQTVTKIETSASSVVESTELTKSSTPEVGVQKDTSRPESRVSDDKVTSVSPAPSAKDEKSPEDTHKSRSQSIVSEKQDISGKATPAEFSRPQSVVSNISVQDESKSPIPPTKAEPTDTKPESRSQSVASVVSEEKVEIDEAQKSRSQSIVSEKQDASGKATPAESSRPESAASDKKSDEPIAKSPSPSAESGKKDSLEKVDDKVALKSDTSRPESVASDTSAKDGQKSPIPSIKEEQITTKVESRSQSISSVISAEKEDDNKSITSASPCPSVDSAKKDSLEKSDEKIELKGDVSRPESSASVKDESKSPIPPTKAEPTDTKPEFRSQSVASVVSEEKIEIAEGQKSRSQSIVSEKQDASGKATPAESSRPESAASDTKSDEPIPKSPSPSIESVKKDSLEKSDDKISLKGDTSRPVSALSDMSAKEIPKSSSPLPKEEPKAESRSQSVASVVSEEKVEVSVEQKLRSQSIVSEKQDISGKATPIEASRPESSASDKKTEVSKSPTPSIDKIDGKVKSESANLIDAEKKLAEIQTEIHSKAVSQDTTTKSTETTTTIVKESSEKDEQFDEAKDEDEDEDGGGDLIGIQIATGSTMHGVHDTDAKKIGDKGTVDDNFDVHGLSKKADVHSVKKESRSKSVASISVFGSAKTPQTIDLEQITEVSKDDSNLGGSSRKASDISTLIEDVKKIDEKIAGKASASDKAEQNNVAKTVTATTTTTVVTTITKEESHLVDVDSKLSQQKSAHSSLESTASDKGSIETVLESGALSSFDIKEQSFDLSASTKEATPSVHVATKEISTIKSELKTFRDSDNESLPISDDEAVTSSQKYPYEDYQFERSNSELSKKSDLDIDDSQNDIPPQYGSQEFKSAVTVSTSYAMDPMSASFYGELPGETDKLEPATTVSTVRTVITKQFDSHGDGEPISQITQETFTTKSGDHKFLDEADLDFEKAMEEHRQVRGPEVMSSITSKYEFSPSKFPATQLAEAAADFPLTDVKSVKEQPKEEASSSTDVLARQLEDNLKKAEERVASWGKPLGLPVSINENPPTPKKERKITSAKLKLNNEKNIQKRANSPNKSKKSTPIYMDLTYVPHNGNSYYSHVEFFKRVRARYYVFSGTEPSRDVYNALLEAKQTWEDKSLEVTIIPTYDTDVLGYWVAENEELLAKYHIDLSPSASRCTINLQDHETCCSAYRLEF